MFPPFLSVPGKRPFLALLLRSKGAQPIERHFGTLLSGAGAKHRRPADELPRRAIRAYTLAELEAIAKELPAVYRGAPALHCGDRAAARGMAGARAPRR